MAFEKIGQRPKSRMLRRVVREVDIKDTGSIKIDDFMTTLEKKTMEPEGTSDDVLETFDAIDLNKTGYIEKDELRDIMSAIGFDLTDEELLEMIIEADKDKDGRISYKEFQEMMKEEPPREKSYYM